MKLSPQTKMNSQFIVTLSQCSSKCETKSKVHCSPNISLVQGSQQLGQVLKHGSIIFFEHTKKGLNMQPLFCGRSYVARLLGGTRASIIFQFLEKSLNHHIYTTSSSKQAKEQLTKLFANWISYPFHKSKLLNFELIFYHIMFSLASYYTLG